MPPLSFGPEVQYFDELLKKAGLYALFLYCHSERKSVFFCKVTSSHTTAGTRGFCQNQVCVSCRHFQYLSAGI